MLRNITLDRPLAVLDLETTGTDTKTDRIVEVSVLRAIASEALRPVLIQVVSFDEAPQTPEYLETGETSRQDCRAVRMRPCYAEPAGGAGASKRAVDESWCARAQRAGTARSANSRGGRRGAVSRVLPEDEHRPAESCKRVRRGTGQAGEDLEGHQGQRRRLGSPPFSAGTKARDLRARPP
jgi:hypothetical protein